MALYPRSMRRLSQLQSSKYISTAIWPIHPIPGQAADMFKLVACYFLSNVHGNNSSGNMVRSLFAKPSTSAPEGGKRLGISPAKLEEDSKDSLEVGSLVGQAEGVCPDGQLDVAGIIKAFHLYTTHRTKRTSTCIAGNFARGRGRI
eukprot:1157261-Pelagomonas_calceolata.AAC.7